MTFSEFTSSVVSGDSPPHVAEELKGLWWDRKGDWHKSHETVQDLETKEAAWVHAYLHRKEGDVWNADYWYRRAGRVRPAESLEQEWENIVKELLA